MISVVIPVFNKRRTLVRTVETVLSQTFGDFELILVDDGSTDGSLEAVAAVNDYRVRRLHQRNAGAGPARNTGIADARGAWVALLDGDDLWADDHLAELDRIRRLYPGAGLIGTASKVAPASRAEATLLGLGGPRPGRVGTIDLIEALGRGERPLFTSSAALRKSVWEEVGGFRPYSTGQDRELFVRLSLAAPVAVSDRATAIAVTGTGGISDQRLTRKRAVPTRLHDLTPSVGTLLDAKPTLSDAQKRSIDLYVRRYLHWAIQEAVQTQDTEGLRALRTLYEAPVHWRHLLPLAIALMPERAAGFALRLLSRMPILE